MWIIQRRLVTESVWIDLQECETQESAKNTLRGWKDFEAQSNLKRRYKYRLVFDQTAYDAMIEEIYQENC